MNERNEFVGQRRKPEINFAKTKNLIAKSNKNNHNENLGIESKDLGLHRPNLQQNPFQFPADVLFATRTGALYGR
jgi:hypothetical protein